MAKSWACFRPFGKVLFLFVLMPLFLGACSINPATGEKQFTALMPVSQESKIGAEQHPQVIETYGEVENVALRQYVQALGNKVAANTERPDVSYTFTVIDTPMVNAFAIPGGYIYLSRGLIAQANSEAELAAVIAHEIGHITARHSAERYSHGVLSSLGAVVLAAATESKSVAQAAGLGSNLYISSYSRGQEHQADDLGVRYLHRAGYDPFAMASFLANLQQQTAFESRLSGGSGKPSFSYFSTHPQTADRVAEASQIAAGYPKGPDQVNRESYLPRLEGLTYGDSARHGFARGRNFYHPGIGFTYTVPEGFRIINQPTEVVAFGPNGAVILLDAASSAQGADAFTYMTQEWMRGEQLQTPERIMINGLSAATAAFGGTVDGKPVTIRIVAIEWEPNRFFRFQMAIPRGSDGQFIEGLKNTTYSFRRMSDQEKQTIKPYRLRIVTAKAGDSVSTLAARMAFDDYKEERFRSLNHLAASEGLVAGRQYKIVVD